MQVGSATIGGADHASLWTGSAASWVDLNPAGATNSTVYGIYGTQQAGRATIGGVSRAGIWNSTASSWIDLNPAGATSSLASAVFNGVQVGNAVVGGVQRASLWNGTTSSWQDLSLVVPGSWNYTLATGVWGDATTLYVGGFGFNTATGREEALLWSRPIPGPGALPLIGGAGLLAGSRRRRMSYPN